MKRFLLFGGILAVVALLVWSASKAPAVFPVVPVRVSPAPAETLVPPQPCETCAQATQAAALTQDQINLSAFQAQAQATADILGSHALATANAGAATQGVALTQARVDANVLQAQAAATADILRVQALATANAGAATQSAAQAQAKLTADSLQAQAAATADRLQANNALATATAGAATQSAAQTEVGFRQFRLQLTSGAATHQRLVGLAAGTATASARAAALQAQTNLAQGQAASAWLWLWFTPLVIIVAAVISLWGAARWLAQRRPQPVGAGDPGPAPLTEPDDRRQVRGWLEEVRDKLLSQRKG